MNATSPRYAIERTITNPLSLPNDVQSSLPSVTRFFAPVRAKKRVTDGSDDWTSFGKLSGFVIVRSMAYLGLVAFIPIYVVEVLHGSPAVGGLTDTAFLLAGAAGTIAGGPIADRVGRKPVLLWSTGLTVIMVAVLVALTRNGAPLPLAIGILIPTGFVLVASQASFVVLGQEYLPNRVGLASGVTLGLAVSLGGGLSPALGATLVALTLPAETRRTTRPSEAVAPT